MQHYVSNAAKDMYSHIKHLTEYDLIQATTAWLPTLAVWSWRVLRYEANESDLIKKGHTLNSHNLKCDIHRILHWFATVCVKNNSSANTMLILNTKSFLCCFLFFFFHLVINKLYGHFEAIVSRGGIAFNIVELLWPLM